MWHAILWLVWAGASLLEQVFEQRRLGIWKQAAASCGLRGVKLGRQGLQGVTAREPPMEVRIEKIRDTWSQRGSRVIIAIPGPPGFPGVKICRQGLKPAREIEVGDALFDDAFWIDIDGPTRLVIALLDQETRHLLARMNGKSRRLEIACGELRAEMLDPQVADLLPSLLDLGRRLARPLDLAQRLADNGFRDEEAGVRLRNLLLLAREFPRKPRIVAALHAGCVDPSAEVRLRSAIELGAEGREVLLKLAETSDDDVDDRVSSQAVAFLSHELPLERTKDILSLALRRRRIETARACLAALGERRDADAVQTLAKVLARERGELAVAAALALGANATPDAEPPLIRALEQNTTAVAAATALGRFGSAAAVTALREAAERFSRDSELRRAARQAIAEIQSRLPGASPGQLSLAGTEAGQLSLAQVESGQVSLAQTEAGQLSVAQAERGQLSVADPVGQAMPAAQSERGTGGG